MSAKNLSIDAKVLAFTWFKWGAKSTVTIGGDDAVNVLSDRAAPAIKQLIEFGFVTQKLFNNYGRMQYIGTDKCLNLKLTAKEIREHGNWAATKPNPKNQQKGD